MKIRKAEPGDLERIMEMGERFVSETTYNDHIRLDPERLSQTIVNVVTNPNGVILVSENGKGVDGMIALLIGDHPYSGQRTAYELVWWVEPEARGYGRQLLSAAEGWAKENGALAIQMVAPTQRVAALYKALGYTLIESSYGRSL